MKIEVGKTYKTRDGGVATVLDFLEYEGHFPFGGKIQYADGRIDEDWNIDGRASRVREKPTDIIEEIQQPAHSNKTTQP